MARVDLPAQGLAPQDPRYRETALDESFSSYTQAGPRPGVAIPTNAKQNAAPVMSGDQETAIDLKVSKAGDPSIDRRGSAVLWKTDAEAVTAYRGWASPVWCWRSDPVHFSTTATITTLDACVDHDSQRLTVIHAEGSTSPLKYRVLTESDQTLTASDEVLVVGGGAGSMRGPASILSLPDGRRLIVEFYGPANLQGPTVYSQDTVGGAWTQLSDDPFPGGTSFISGAIDGLWIRYARGQILCLMTDTGGNLHQLASADLGASFRFVETIAGVSGQGVGVDVYADGTILVVAHDTTDDKLEAFRLGSAFAAISDAPKVELPTRDPVVQASLPLTVSIDADGTAYCLTYDSINDGPLSVYVIMYESTDGGLNWVEYTDGPVGSVGMGLFTMLRSACVNGRLYLFTVLSNATGAWMHTCSGWSNVTPGPNHTNTGRNGLAGNYGLTSALNGNWYAALLPASGVNGYTPGGSGTGILNGSDTDERYLQVTTSANTRFYSAQQSGVTAGASAVVEWSMQAISGGGKSSTRIGVSLRHRSLAGNEIVLLVNIDSTGSLRLTDGTTSSDAVLTTNVRRDYLLELNGLTARLYSRLHPAEVWEQIATIISITTGGAVTIARTTWGHLSSASAQSRWWFFAHRHEDTEVKRSFGTGINEQIGKRIAASPYPLPGIGSSTREAFVRIVGGFNRPIGTPDFNLDPSHDYPIGSIFPDASPSPDATWRSTSDGSVIDIVVGLQPGVDSRLDEALPAVVIRNANFRQVEVATGTAAGTFTTIGTLDLNFGLPTGIAYTLAGDAVSITGSPTPTRWLHADELAGGHIDFGSGVVRKILGHTAGCPTASATVQPVFRIDSPGGVSASGTCRIVHHSGVLVLSGYTPAAVRFWRFRIPVQDTAEGYFEIGSLALTSVVAMGKRWGQGFTYAVEPVISSTDSASGTRRIEERGTPRRRLTVSWQHGTNLHQLRTNQANVDHISAGAPTAVLAGRDDVIWQLEALQSRCESGRLPVLVLPAIPEQTETITDPSLYLFGVLEGTIQSSHVLGDEGSDEFIRIESLTVTELV